MLFEFVKDTREFFDPVPFRYIWGEDGTLNDSLVSSVYKSFLYTTTSVSLYSPRDNTTMS